MLLFLLSPAKNLEESKPAVFSSKNTPIFLNESEKLIEVLQKLAPFELEKLMKISEKLALLNAERFDNFHTPFTEDNAKSAIYLFNGDVYDALDTYSMDKTEIDYLENHLCILSGLYGILKPLDLIQPYRLEMGTRLTTDSYKNLYEFWGNKITDHINHIIKEKKITHVINLASNEYFSVINPSKIKTPIITPVFKDYKNGSYKVISFNAKKARGLMMQFATKNQIDNLDALKDFSLNGYQLDSINQNEWLFLKQP